MSRRFEDVFGRLPRTSNRAPKECLPSRLMTIFSPRHLTKLWLKRPNGKKERKKIIQIFARLEESTVEKRRRDYVIVRSRGINSRSHIRNITSNVKNDFDKYLTRFFISSCRQSRVEFTSSSVNRTLLVELAVYLSQYPFIQLTPISMEA